MNAEVLRHMISYEMQMHNVHQKADKNAGLHAALASTQFQNLLKYFLQLNYLIISISIHHSCQFFIAVMQSKVMQTKTGNFLQFCQNLGFAI